MYEGEKRWRIELEELVEAYKKDLEDRMNQSMMDKVLLDRDEKGSEFERKLSKMSGQDFEIASIRQSLDFFANRDMGAMMNRIGDEDNAFDCSPRVGYQREKSTVSYMGDNELLSVNSS